MKKSALYASAVVVLSVLFAVSSRLHIAVVEQPVGLLAGPPGMNGVPLSSNDGFIDESLSSPGHGGPLIEWRTANVFPSGDGNYLTWMRYHSNTLMAEVIAVQKFDPSGTPLWGDGVVVSGDGVDAAETAGIVSDGAGGAFAFLNGVVNPEGVVYIPKVWVQRVNAAGNAVFPEPVEAFASGDCTAAGVNISLGTYDQTSRAKMSVADGTGGIILAYTTDTNLVCVQRLDGAGNRIWGDAGVTLASGGGKIYVTADGAGGAFVGVSGGDSALHHLAAADGGEVSGCPANIAGEDLLGTLADGAGGAIAASGSGLPEPVLRRFGANCSVDPGWSGAVPLGDNMSGNALDLEIIGGNIIATWTDAEGPANAMSNSFSLADGASAWGGAKTVDPGMRPDGYGNNFTPGSIYALPAGGDILYILPDTAWSPSMSKLDAATGEPVPPFGGVQLISVYGGSVISAATDGAGGAMVVYRKSDDGNIYAQRFDGSGSGMSFHGMPSIPTDQGDMFRSEGGGYITWYRLDRYDGQPQIAVQKFDNDGTMLWGDGIIVNPNWAPRVHATVHIATDGAGGVYAVWAEGQVTAEEDPTYDGNAYVQRVNSAGETVFPAPVALDLSEQCGAPDWDMGWQGHWAWFGPGAHDFTGDYPFNKWVVPDGSGNVMMMWMSSFYGMYYCAQKIDASGSRVWGDNGLYFTRSGWPTLITEDGAGGAFIGDGILGGGVLDHVNTAGALVPGCQVGVGPGPMFDLEYDGSGNVIAFFASGDGSDVTADSFGPDCSHNANWPIGGVAISTNMKTWYPDGAALVNGDKIQFSYLSEDNGSTLVSVLDTDDGTILYGGEQTIYSVANGLSWSEPVLGTADLELYSTALSSGGSYPTGGSVDTVIDRLHSTNSSADSLSASYIPKAVVSDGGTGFIYVYQDTNDNYLYAEHRYFQDDGGGSWSLQTDWTHFSLTSPQYTMPVIDGLWPESYLLLSPPIAQPEHHFGIDQDNDRSVNVVAAPNGNKAVFWTEREIWTDYRAPQTYTMYMKMLDESGSPIGPNNGLVTVDQSTGTGPNFYVSFGRAAADSTGFYVVYTKNINTEAYVVAQKYDLTGTALWSSAPHVFAGDQGNSRYYLNLDLDGAGGIYVAFRGADDLLHVNRLDQDGQPLWGAGGTVLTTSFNGGSRSYLSADEQGVYVAWSSGYVWPAGFGSYVSRLEAATGAPVAGWNGTNGVLVGSFYSPGNVYDVISANGGGVYVGTAAYPPYQSNLVNKVGADGTVLWGDRGISLGSAAFYMPKNFKLIPDGAGGFFANWFDYHGSSGNWYRVQHVDQDGNQLWGTPNVATTTAELHSGSGNISADDVSDFLSGPMEINGTQGFCSARSGDTLYGCQHLPDAPAGATITQHVGLLYDDIDPAAMSFDMVLDADGGLAVLQTGTTQTSGGWSQMAVVMYHIDAEGNMLYGGRIVLSDVEQYWAVATWYGTGVSFVRDESVGFPRSLFGVWIAGTGWPGEPSIPNRVFGQRFTFSPPSPAGSPPSAPPALPPAGGPAPVTVTATTATICFTNEGNAPGGYHVYQNNPDGTRTLLGETTDPTATCVTVIDLTPDTTYTGVVVIPVGDRGEGASSPEYPPFTTPPTGEPHVVLTKEVDVFKASLQVPAVGEPASSFPTAGPYVKEGEQQTYTIPDSLKSISPNTALTYDLNRLQGTIDTLTAGPTALDTTKDRAILRYRVTARNDGSVAAYNIDITDRIPDFMAYQPESTVIDNALNTDAIDLDRVVYIEETGTLKVKISELKPGETKFFTFDTVLVTRPTDGIRNKATATYTDVRP